MVVFTIPPPQGCQPDCQGLLVHRLEIGSASASYFVRLGDVCTALGGGVKAWNTGLKLHELCRSTGFFVNKQCVLLFHCVFSDVVLCSQCRC